MYSIRCFKIFFLMCIFKMHFEDTLIERYVLREAYPKSNEIKFNEVDDAMVCIEETTVSKTSVLAFMLPSSVSSHVSSHVIRLALK